ncbi:LOW QUALITY PROTEIN: bcl-2-like protein 13 [Synchiropus picturatus]
MATSGPTSSASITTTTTVPEGFHYETKFIVLSCLGMLPVNKAQALSESQVERRTLIRKEVAEELSKLDDEIAASGFDRNASPVFRPATPETSIEDVLADMGDKVAQDLDPHLPAAVRALLPGESSLLEYEAFRKAALDLLTHTRDSWSKVLVPLVLLQALQHEGQCVQTLLHVGVHFLEEEAEDIIQHGGWGEIFGQESEVEPSDVIAEDSNDIYILSADPHLERLSPEPASLLCQGDGNSLQSSWQTESLPVSWAQISSMDADDSKSMDSTDGAALAEERSENNSSNSDIVHVEREELLDEGGEAVEESMMSVLGSESEMAELREQTPPVPGASDAEPTSLVSIDEPVVIETPVSLTSEPSIITLSGEPSLISLEPELPPAAPEAAEPEPEPEPEPAVPSLDPAVEPEGEISAVTAEVLPQSEPPVTSSTAPAEPETISEPEPTPDPEPPTVPPESEPDAQLEPRLAPIAAESPVQPPVMEPAAQAESQCELPALIYGGAALVALAGVVVYGVISYRRK